jgi:hypothetical protein
MIAPGVGGLAALFKGLDGIGGATVVAPEAVRLGGFSVQHPPDELDATGSVLRSHDDPDAPPHIAALGTHKEGVIRHAASKLRQRVADIEASGTGDHPAGAGVEVFVMGSDGCGLYVCHDCSRFRQMCSPTSRATMMASGRAVMKKKKK